jgi:hypothetical protein
MACFPCFFERGTSFLMAGELTFVLIGEKMNLGPSHQCSICLYGIMAKLLPKQKLDLSLLVYLGGQVYSYNSFGCPAILLCSLAITNITIINWYWHTVCITICICYHYHCIVLSDLCSIDWYSFWNDSYIVSHLVISTVLLYWAPLNIEWWNHQASTSSKINMVDIIIYIICSLV